MKKIILSLFIVLGLFNVSHLAFAADVYGFLDGKFYDVNQVLKYICFLDGNCYDANLQPAPFKIVPANQPTPTPVPVDICPNIEGSQTVIPEGLIKSDNGNCIVPIQAPSSNPVNNTPTQNITNPTPQSTPSPASFIDVYESVSDISTGTSLFKDKNVVSITAKKHINSVNFSTHAYNTNGQQINSDVVVTTNYPDMPATFTIKSNSGFYVGDHHQSGIIQDNNTTSACSSVISSDGNDGCTPESIGTFNFTFTQPDLNVSRTIQLTINPNN